MAEHEKWLELISASLDGELKDADRAALEEHLASCPECRRVYEAFQAIGENFPAETEPPANFTEGTMYLIRQEAARPTGWKRFFGNYGRWTGVAAAAVVLLLGFGAIRSGLLKAPTANESAMSGAGAPSASTAAEAGATEAPQAVESTTLTMDFAEEESAEMEEDTFSVSLQAVPQESGSIPELEGEAETSQMASGAVANAADDEGNRNTTGLSDDGVEAEEAAPEAPYAVWEGAEEAELEVMTEAPAEAEEMPAEAAEPDPSPEEAPRSGADGAESTLVQGFQTAISPGTLLERFGGQGWYAVGVLQTLPGNTEDLQEEKDLGAGIYSLPREKMDVLIRAVAFDTMIFDEDAAERGLVIVLSEGE